MREYAKLAPTFWTGETGKALRRRGSETVIVALYLVSSPHSNMLGLYYQAILYIAHETGLGIEGAKKGLQACIDVGFCSYDEDTEMVFVHEMAAWQIADELKGVDLRCKGIQKEYDALPNCPFLGPFFDRYAAAFHMVRRRAGMVESVATEQAPSLPPSKPLRSQEQEQEHEQEQELSPSDSRPQPEAANVRAVPCPQDRIRELYHEVLPTLPRVRKWDNDRAAALRSRWGEMAKDKAWTGADDGVQWFRRFFERVGMSDFLMGRTQREDRHAAWRCDIDFLLSRKGFRGVLEGKYNATQEGSA